MSTRHPFQGRDEDAYEEPMHVDGSTDDELHWPTIDYSPRAADTPLLQIAGRDPLTMYAEHTGIPKEFWQELGVKSEGDRFVAFTWPQGWKKVRNVLLRVDAKTRDDKTLPRFHWILPPANAVKPLWPHMGESEDGSPLTHEEIWITEGESDCATLRYAGFDAYTYGSAKAFPGEIELRLLQRHGVKRAMLCFDADQYGRQAAAKIGGLLAERGIDIIQVDLGPALTAWDYLKDVRDLFKHLTREGLRDLLNGLVATELAKREDDISVAAQLEHVLSPEWAWDGLAARASLILLYGPAKSGKTLLCHHLIKAMHHGTRLLGRMVRKEKVLYYSEMPPSIDKERVADILLDGGVRAWKELDHFFIRPSSHPVFDSMHSWPEIVVQLEKDCERYQIGYVILDTVNEWMHFPEGGMYDPTVVADRLRLLRRLTEKGITVQVNHHPPKVGGSPLGSVAFQAVVDCLIEMEKVEKGTKLTAVGRLRSDFESVLYLPENDVLRIIEVQDDAATSKTTVTAKERLMQILPKSPDYMSVKEMMTRDGMLEQLGAAQIRARLADLEREGLVIADRTFKETLFSKVADKSAGGIPVEVVGGA